MRYLQPQRWAEVPIGTVMLDPYTSTARRVIANDALGLNHRWILMEGLPPQTWHNDTPAQPVELDTADAIGNLFAAGLTVTPIEGNGS